MKKYVKSEFLCQKQKKPANSHRCILSISSASSTPRPSCVGRTWLRKSRPPRHRRCHFRPSICPMLTSTCHFTMIIKSRRSRRNTTTTSLILVHQSTHRHILPSFLSRHFPRAGIPNPRRRSRYTISQSQTRSFLSGTRPHRLHWNIATLHLDHPMSPRRCSRSSSMPPVLYWLRSAYLGPLNWTLNRHLHPPPPVPRWHRGPITTNFPHPAHP